MDFASLHDAMMERLDFRALFVHCGLSLAEEPDAEGWLVCPSCFAPGKQMRVNLQDGGWMDEVIHPEPASIYDFIVTVKKLAAGQDGMVEALRYLCEFCGLAKEFANCSQPPPAKPGEVEPIKKDILTAWKRGLTLMRERLESLSGLNVKSMEKYSLGWVKGQTLKLDRGAFIVPIPDFDGICRSARLVDEDLKSMWTPRGMVKHPRMDRSPKLFGIDEIYSDNWSTVVITQNEFDRMILMQERERHDWGSVSVIDNTYLRPWNKYFEGRAVVICFHGDRKSKAYAECVLAPLLKLEKDRGKILSVKLVTLPLSGLPADKTITQWFKAGGKWKNFQQIVESTSEWIPPNAPDGEKSHKILASFSEIDDPANTDMKVQVPLCVSGETNIVYDSPTEFEVAYCSEINSGRCELCKNKTFEIPIGRPQHIASYKSAEPQREQMCRDICCPLNKKPKIKFLQKATFRVVDASQYCTRVVEREDKDGKPNTRIDGRNESLTQRMIYVRIPEGRAEPLEPRGYNAIGWVTTNPKNAERTLLVESLTALEEGYESFKIQDHVGELTKMKALGWNGIVQDLTQHVTMIFGYDELLLITLLTYCSPLSIRFNGEFIRGWLTAAVIGDSGVGKSKVFERVSELLGVGDIFSCLTGRRTGLTYSIVKTASNWRCQSGLQPRNTRKILCVEEAQEMPQRDIKSMAIAMDTGRLDVEGVARGSYESKTRLIFNCNPATERTLSSYQYGCMAIRDLFSHMFIRRIDIAAFIRRMENGSDHYNRKAAKAAKGKISAEDLRSLVYFAWNLTADRIVIPEDVTDLILEKTKLLSQIFGGCDDIPLVCPSDFRNTLTRIATAWAVLDLSVTDDFQTVHVQQKHVNNAEVFCRTLYTHADCGLDQYSNLSRRQTRLEDYSIIETDMIARINANGRDAIAGRSPFPRLIFILNRGLRYTKDDLKRLLPANESFLSEVLNFLSGHHLINIGNDDKVFTTPKYNRFFKRFTDTHPDMVGIINLAADHIDTEQEPVNE